MSPRQIGLLAALSAVWGGSYLLIKYALEDLDPAVIVWVRLVLAAGLLFPGLRLRGGGAGGAGPAGAGGRGGGGGGAGAPPAGRPPGRGPALLRGAVATPLPFTLTPFGGPGARGGRGGVLTAPASLFVAAFAPLIDPSEK